MSYIAAVGAKNRVSSYLDNSFDAFDSVGAGMRAGAARDVAETQYGAMSDYYSDTGAAEIAGIKKAGSAAIQAGNQAAIGSALGTVGSLAMGVSDFGVENWGWGKG